MRERLANSVSCCALLVLLAFSLCTPLPSTAQAKQDLLYVGTYTDHGSRGIYAYHLDPANGKLTSLGLAAASDNPSFLAITPRARFLYAANEVNSFQDHPTGAVSAFALKPGTIQLSALNEVSSGSPGPAYLTLDRTGKYVLVANYPHGSVAVFPVLKDGRLGEATAFVQHHGSSINPNRQEGPHAHCIATSPDNRFAIVADLGLDELLVYPFSATKGSLGKPHIVKVHPGWGPRHLAFSKDGKFLYLITEMGSRIVVYSYHAADGALGELQNISTLPPKFAGSNTAAEIEISPSGQFLYASNRGDNNSIAIFAITSARGTLKLVEIDPSGGKTPRNFAIDPSGSWLVAANQDSDNIVVFHINKTTGRLTETHESAQLSEPVCVLFVH
jgi:6-phosphogluconolactonase